MCFAAASRASPAAQWRGASAAAPGQGAMLEPEAVAAITPQSASTTVEPEVAALPLNDYRMIAERNLFNVSKKKKPPAPKKEIEIEKIDT